MPRDSPDVLKVAVDKSACFRNPFGFASDHGRHAAVEAYREYISCVVAGMPRALSSIASQYNVPEELVDSSCRASCLSKGLAKLGHLRAQGYTLILVCKCVPKACHGIEIAKVLQ